MSPLVALLAGAAAVVGAEAARRMAGPGRVAEIAAGARGAAAGARSGWAALLAERARRAAWPGGGRGLVLCLLAVAGGGLALGTVLAGPVAGFGAALVALAATGMAVRVRERRRLDAVAAHVPELCEQLGAAIRVGRSLRASLERAARAAPEPARTELRALAGDLALGARVEDALRAAAARIPVEELAAVTATIEVQRRAGGSLVRALDDLSVRLRARRRLVAELRSATAQARATAWIVGGIPLVGAIAVEATAPGTLGRLLGSGIGPALLAVSGTLYAAAILAVARISRVAS